MDENIRAISGLCADVWQALGHADAPHQQMSDAAVVTTAFVAMRFFRGNCAAARALLCAPWYRPHRLSRSRVNRRCPRLNDLLGTLCEL
jgi:hypothetical protein